MPVYQIRTDPDAQFTGALATNAIATENLVQSAFGGVDRNIQLVLTGLTLVSDQNLAWEIGIYGTDVFNSADPELNQFLGSWAFAASDGTQVAATGPYRYYIDGLSIPIMDYDKTSEIHLALVNRSVTSKNAGATGEITVTLWVQSMQVGGS